MCSLLGEPQNCDSEKGLLMFPVRLLNHRGTGTQGWGRRIKYLLLKSVRLERFCVGLEVKEP